MIEPFEYVADPAVTPDHWWQRDLSPNTNLPMKTYAPYQIRVLDEKSELDLKIEALKDFINNQTLFDRLPEGEQLRLPRQLAAMKSYSGILDERIQHFVMDYTTPALRKADLIRQSKTFRQALDKTLQTMKEWKARIRAASSTEMEDADEVIAQHVLSTRDLESATMRQGMALKYIGNPDPYPQSKDPSSTVVEPTADGLKL